jgi:hypothetical protein
MKRWLVVSFSILSLSLSVAACGGGGSGDIDGPPGGGGDGPPGGGDGAPAADALTPPNCMAGTTECTDCIDNDGDGRTDGYDIECTGAADDREDSFETGIPGDNMDTVKQDCFFDGNSGSGDDGCEIHVCCLLGAPDQASCPFGANQYDPAECDDPQSQLCLDECAPLTPPGCDCFGCCTVCDDAGCVDIITNPATAPNCDDDSIHDPVACPVCVKNDSCGTPCDPANCILCPGQDPSDLPGSCSGNECPGGAQECTTQACPENSYCHGGCCISVID